MHPARWIGSIHGEHPVTRERACEVFVPQTGSAANLVWSLLDRSCSASVDRSSYGSIISSAHPLHQWIHQLVSSKEECRTSSTLSTTITETVNSELPRRPRAAMASTAPPAFLPQLVQLVQSVSVLPDQLTERSPPPPREGAGGRVHRQLAGPKRPDSPREGRGGDGGVIHAFPLEFY